MYNLYTVPTLNLLIYARNFILCLIIVMSYKIE